MDKLDQIMQQQDIILSGHRVHFWIGGSGPHLLLLHAAWGDASMGWSNVWNELAQSFTVIAPDLPGYGKSSPLPQPSLPAMARLVKLLLDELKVERTIVAGNSFSASVAIQFANAYPEAMSHLILVNGGAMPPIPGPIRAIISLPLIKQVFRALIRNMSYSRRMLNSSFVDQSKLPPGFFDKILEKAAVYSRVGFETIMNTKEPQAPPTAPTLLLWGARDHLAQMKHARLLLEWIPGSKLVALEESGHMPQWEQPEEFVAAIRQFVL